MMTGAHVSTFLLSWLGKKYGALDASLFLREQPGDWLVLEDAPGNPVRTGEAVPRPLFVGVGVLAFTAAAIAVVW